MRKNIAIGILVLLVIVMGAFIIADVAQAPEDGVETPRGGMDGVPNKRVVSAFKEGLEKGVREERGQPIEGYEPFMFMDVFQKLAPQDFDGVEAAIGHYTYTDGELEHDLEGETMVHSAAGSITQAGIATLLHNVTVRLAIEPGVEAETILQILRGGDSVSEKNKDNGPVVCTMDAKLCPDGSYVGRVGPDCEFAACPASAGTVCTSKMKQVDACTQQYDPVCGLVEVQCVTEPCEPVPKNFGNGCMACLEGDVISYTDGKCEE